MRRPVGVLCPADKNVARLSGRLLGVHAAPNNRTTSQPNNQPTVEEFDVE